MRTVGVLRKTLTVVVFSWYRSRVGFDDNTVTAILRREKMKSCSQHCKPWIAD